MRIRSTRSFFSTALAAILWRILSFSQERIEPLGLPRLLCLPSDFLGKHLICNGVFERETMEYVGTLIENRPLRPAFKSVFIDIGANIGNHTCFFAPRFDLTIAIEPSAVTASILRANLLLNELSDRVTVVQAAVSDHNGKAKHHTASGNNLGGSSLDGQRRDTLHSKAEEVDLVTGDFVAATHTDATSILSFVKIDVEGHELAVISGMKEVIRRDKPIIMFEADNGKSATACVGVIRELGYSRFIEVSGDADAGISSLMRLLKRFVSGAKSIEAKELAVVDPAKYYETILCVPDVQV